MMKNMVMGAASVAAIGALSATVYYVQNQSQLTEDVQIASIEPKSETLEPGVIRIPLKRKHVEMGRMPDDGPPRLESGHPRVGNWSDAEMWDGLVKEETNTLDNIMYTMDCMLGTPSSGSAEVQQCIVDSSTSLSSTFAFGFYTYSWDQYNPSDSTTYHNIGVTKTFQSIGLTWTGYKYTDNWCIGGGDIHTTVCIDSLPFIYVDEQELVNKAQWVPPLRDFDNVNTIVGFGKPSSSDASYNFLDIAYEAGLIKDNAFTFQGDLVNEGQAHVTLGGYSKQDYTGDIDWFNMADQDSWTVNMKNFTLGSYNLLEPPTTSTNRAFEEQNERLLEDADPFYTYGHFNTGYPFLGVDQATGEMIE